MNKKLKQIAASLLSVLMIVCFMPSMAFAAEETADVVAKVTTSETTEPISYTSFDEALTKTNVKANEGKKPVITLENDATASAATVAYPMVIKLNGHKLEGADKITPAVGAMGSSLAEGGICRKDDSETITFAKHKTTTVYNWSQKTDGSWEVLTKNVSCDTCGEKTETVKGTVNPNTTAEEGKIIYEFTEEGATDISSTKTVDAVEAPVYTDAKANIVQVNGVNQHKDGLPVVKATVFDSSINDRIDATAKVTAATDAELKKIGETSSTIKVFEEDGVTESSTRKNVEATCQVEGKTIYKVVVSGPDGKELDPIYLVDSKAAETTAHVKGALKGYQILVHSTGFESESAARDDAKAAKATVIKIDTTKVSGAVKYRYWYYDAVQTVPNTETQSTTANVTPSKAAFGEDGSFTYRLVYFCNFEPNHENEVPGEAVTVKPLPDATTAAEANDGKHSSCISYSYANIVDTYEFGTGVVKYMYTFTGKVINTNADKTVATHVSDGTKRDVLKQPTCAEEGEANVKCAICGKSDDTTVVKVPKLEDTFGAFPGTDKPTAKAVLGVDTNQEVELNADRTEATVYPTCLLPGGVYKYCTGTNNKGTGHWVLKEELKATGHTYADKIVEGDWITSDEGKTFGDVNSKYDSKNDYVFKAQQQCSNPRCDAGAHYFPVRYHSIPGTDTAFDKYSAVEIKDEKAGADCQTDAKTVYTVKNLTDRTGKAIVKEFVKPNTKGPHKYEATGFNWSKDFESATVTAKCTVKNCKETSLSQKATVTKATDSTGLTTYTATYGDKTDTKKVYTLKGAEVTYNTAEVTDGNLIKGIKGYAAAQTPEVTVKLNGTEIDSDNLEEVWDYTGSTVTLEVRWADSVTAEGVDAKTADTARAKDFKVAKKSVFSAPTTTFKDGGKQTTTLTRDYNPDKAFEVVTKTTVKSATVKYAISDEKVEGETAAETQEDIEDLDYDLDAVEGIQDAGEYYVYAQISADKYTTYTALVGTIVIKPMHVIATCDGATFTEGEDPEINIVFRSGSKIVNIEKSLIKVVSAGGKALSELKPGKYYILVTADNYDVDSSTAQVTVLAKDGKSAEDKVAEEAKARQAAVDAAAAAAKADEEAAAAVKAAEEKAAAADKALAEAKTDAEKAAAAKLAAEAAEAAKTADQKAAAAKAANEASVAAAKAAYGADSAQAKDAQAKADAAAAVATKAAADSKTAASKSEALNGKSGSSASATNAKIAKAKKLTVKGLKVTAGKKKATVKFKKTKGVKSYQVMYKIKGKKKWSKKVTKKNKLVVKKLKKGKKYQFKVRTITKVGKKNYYGKWTKVKTVKIKK